MEEKISREDLAKIYQIEIQFFDDLEASGLLHPVVESNVRYLRFEDLQLFEQFTYWHYNMEVNIPGLEILHHFSQKLNALTQENRLLKKQAEHDFPQDFLEF